MSGIVREPKPIYFTKNKWLSKIEPIAYSFEHLGDSLTRKTEIWLKNLLKKTKPVSDSNKENEFANYLLNWPEMSDKEYDSIKEKRKHFKKWK